MWSAVAAIALSGAFGLAGVWLGQHLSSRGEATRLVREQKAATDAAMRERVVRLVSAATRWEIAIGGVFGGLVLNSTRENPKKISSDRLIAQSDRSNQLLQSLLDEVTSVQVLGPNWAIGFADYLGQVSAHLVRDIDQVGQGPQKEAIELADRGLVALRQDIRSASDLFRHNFTHGQTDSWASPQDRAVDDPRGARKLTIEGETRGKTP